ncbi:MAG: hypothetical protein WC069_02245 [Candidatus Shapirobacteria bacterium]
MKNTILSQTDSEILEQLLLKYGRIVNSKDLNSVFNTKYSKFASQNRIQKLCKNGWLKRIKRGLYLVIDNLSSRFQNENSLISISNLLNKNSYISFSYALNYYQMYDQYSKNVIAISKKQSNDFNFDDFVFKFTKVKKSMYFGFSKKNNAGKLINIADVEKVLIDYLYIDKSFTSASLVYEKLKDYQSEIDFSKLQEYTLLCDNTIKRKIGFLLDHININTDKIYQSLDKNTGFSRFTVKSKLFNAKWRIYYDNRITG